MNKKWAKRSMVFVLMFLLIVPQVSFGYSGKENGKGKGEEIVEIENENESVVLGESVKVEGELSEPEMSIMAAHKVVNVISGPTTVKKFVRYLTGSWAKASSYTWSKSNSASSTLSADVGISSGEVSSSIGVSNTVTTTYSVAITIPADSSRYSKLAFYSDYNKRYVRVRLYNTQGLLYSDKYAYHYAPRKDTYLQVVYQ
ncbi:MAG TPA: hypothetical protein VEY70_15870 [Metabacillus sp.]|nr:hypothetical protein [Metabacillus sp.]